MDQAKIGRFIAELRKERKMTQSQLGEKLGVSYKAVSKWETGRNLPDPSLYKPLCDMLGITLTELFNGERIEEKEMARKADQVISDVMEGTRPDRALSILSSAVMVAGIALPFLSVVLDLETTPAIVVVSVGLFFLFAGFSIKLAAWKQVNDKTVKNSGMGFTSALTILFAAMKLTGYTDWRWSWVFSPLWMGLLAVLLLLAVIWVIGRIKKKW